ncbi:MAG: hypothetical protein HOV79_27125 [Hamadaea sp.]|nr:hypothetical protein [Hamadaea sp.]
MPTEDLPSLTPTQLQALVVLMAEAREVNNKELKELAGFALTGKDLTKLVQLGLVETVRKPLPFTHSLTDKGWRVVREIHTAPAPRGAGSAVKSLLVLLANVHRSLDRLQVSHAEFFKHHAVRQEQPDVESAVRSTYHGLAKKPGAWVDLADLRESLPGVERAELDETLRAMARMDGVRVIPIADVKNLDARDRKAAVSIGGQDSHVIAIGLS